MSQDISPAGISTTAPTITLPEGWKIGQWWPRFWDVSLTPYNQSINIKYNIGGSGNVNSKLGDVQNPKEQFYTPYVLASFHRKIWCISRYWLFSIVRIEIFGQAQIASQLSTYGTTTVSFIGVGRTSTRSMVHRGSTRNTTYRRTATTSWSQ
jgi:hypothetical protein